MDAKLWQTLQQLGLTPRNRQLIEMAFTHRSFLNENKARRQSNERLEFLGDSVLSFIISAYLYQQRPEDEEGQLTNLRSYIVKTDSLAKVAEQLALGSYLVMSRGEEQSGGRENTQLLANTYEALLGAIFLDQGLEAAQRLVDKTLLPLFTNEISSGAPRDAKSQLQEVAQNTTKSAPRYKILQTSGPDHAKRFKVGVFVGSKMVGVGEGSNKQQAEEEAARQGLRKLRD